MSRCSKTLLAGSVLIGAMTLGAGAQAAVTPQSGGVSTVAVSTFTPNDAPLDSGVKSAGWTGAGQLADEAVTADASDRQHNILIINSSSAQAHWDKPDGLSGSFQSVALQEVFADHPVSGPDVDATQDSTFAYTVDLSRGATLDLTYDFDLEESSRTVGLFEHLAIRPASGPTQFFDFSRIDPGKAHDGLSVHLGPGAYSFEIDSSASTVGPIGLGFTSTSSALYAWSLQEDAPSGGGPGAVPEPAAWALMLSGFGLVGGTARSGRRRAAAGVPSIVRR